MSPKLKIGLLFIGHFIAQVVVTLMEFGQDLRLSPTATAYLSLFFAEAGLFGIWGALGPARPTWRFATMLMGLLYLAVLNAVAETTGHDIGNFVFLLIALPTFAIVVAVILTRLRYGRRRLCLASPGYTKSLSESFQFSLRHLFVFTTVVAIVSALGRFVKAHVVGDSVGWNVVFLTAIVGIIIPAFIVVELAVIWAAMGIGRPVRRLPVVLPVSFVLGLVPPLFLEQAGWRRYLFWSAMIGLQATITAASLLVVRSCGWRLVRGEPDGTQEASP